MAVHYHIEKLNALLQNLAGVLHVSILILDQSGNILSRIYDPNDYCSHLQVLDGIRPKCQACDRQIVARCKASQRIEKHLCHAGLCDLAMPIIKDGTILAYVVLGRIRTARSPAQSRYQDIPTETESCYRNIPYFSDSQLEHLTQLLPEIVLSGAITVEYDAFEDNIVPYITQHLDLPLSVPFLCRRYHLSKNTLYRYFREHFDCSIGKYITHIRIERAKELLAQTDQAITAIAEQVGIENYTYFCKVFKQKAGQTPTEYRKANNKRPPA